MAEEEADKADKVTHFIYSKQNYSSNRVKHNAFKPPKKFPNELSVFKINNPEMDDGCIWDLGLNYGRKDRKLLARGDLDVADIVDITDGQGGWLKVLYDGDPHPRHGNIKDIPTQDSLRRAVAVELAQKAKLEKINDNG